MLTDATVVLATPADRDRVIDTIVTAFADDPAFRFFFDDPASFAEHATAFARQLFDRRVAAGTAWTIGGGAAVALWDSPTPGTNHGDGPAFPADVQERLDAYHAALSAVLPTTPYWYLGVLATHPDHAGKRWGRAVMSGGLERAAADGLPAYLETTKPRNVEIYRRAGWAVTDSLSVRGLDVWVMVRPS